MENLKKILHEKSLNKKGVNYAKTNLKQNSRNYNYKPLFVLFTCYLFDTPFYLKYHSFHATNPIYPIKTVPTYSESFIVSLFVQPTASTSRSLAAEFYDRLELSSSHRLAEQ